MMIGQETDAMEAAGVIEVGSVRREREIEIDGVLQVGRALTGVDEINAPKEGRGIDVIAGPEAGVTKIAEIGGRNALGYLLRKTSPSRFTPRTSPSMH